jgi:hypothetical protein
VPYRFQERSQISHPLCQYGLGPVSRTLLLRAVARAWSCRALSPPAVRVARCEIASSRLLRVRRLPAAHRAVALPVPFRRTLGRRKVAEVPAARTASGRERGEPHPLRSQSCVRGSVLSCVGSTIAVAGEPAAAGAKALRRRAETFARLPHGTSGKSADPRPYRTSVARRTGARTPPSTQLVLHEDRRMSPSRTSRENLSRGRAGPRAGHTRKLASRGSRSRRGSAAP